MNCKIIDFNSHISFYRFSEKENEGITRIFEWDVWHGQYIDNALKDRERALAKKYEKELSAEVLQELNRTAVAREALLDLFAFLKDESNAGKEEK